VENRRRASTGDTPKWHSFNRQLLTEPKPKTLRTPPIHVMFSDLVGSMALSARMGPVDLREVILGLLEMRR
jgi:class 3 adenylate cyclase